MDSLPFYNFVLFFNKLIEIIIKIKNCTIILHELKIEELNKLLLIVKINRLLFK